MSSSQRKALDFHNKSKRILEFKVECQNQGMLICKVDLIQRCKIISHQIGYLGYEVKGCFQQGSFNQKQKLTIKILSPIYLFKRLELMMRFQKLHRLWLFLQNNNIWEEFYLEKQGFQLQLKIHNLEIYFYHLMHLQDCMVIILQGLSLQPLQVKNLQQ